MAFKYYNCINCNKMEKYISRLIKIKLKETTLLVTFKKKLSIQLTEVVLVDKYSEHWRMTIIVVVLRGGIS